MDLKRKGVLVVATALGTMHQPALEKKKKTPPQNKTPTPKNFYEHLGRGKLRGGRPLTSGGNLDDESASRGSEKAHH